MTPGAARARLHLVPDRPVRPSRRQAPASLAAAAAAYGGLRQAVPKDSLSDFASACGHWAMSAVKVQRSAVLKTVADINGSEAEIETETLPELGAAPACRGSRFSGISLGAANIQVNCDSRVGGALGAHESSDHRTIAGSRPARITHAALNGSTCAPSRRRSR